MNKQEVLEQLVAYLQTINRHIRHASNHTSMQQVTRVQWLLLLHLKRKGDRTIGQLAEFLNVRSSTMSQMVDRLEKANLVTRKQDETDARVKSVYLTETGDEIIRQSKEHWIKELAGPLEHFSEDESSHLVELLKKVVDHLPSREPGSTK